MLRNQLFLSVSFRGGMDAQKEGRILGFTLFTTFTPNDEKWGSFHTEQPTMNKLAKMISVTKVILLID